MTLADQIDATRDSDLLARIIAAAQQKDVPNAQQWAESNRGRIVATDLGDGKSLSSEYALAKKAKGLPAGADPEYVTDDQVLAAVEKLRQAGT